MREHERARRDLEEKMLTFEKNLMHAGEKVIALGQDKEKAIERERGLKARLEDAHTRSPKPRRGWICSRSVSGPWKTEPDLSSSGCVTIWRSASRRRGSAQDRDRPLARGP